MLETQIALLGHNFETLRPCELAIQPGLEGRNHPRHFRLCSRMISGGGSENEHSFRCFSSYDRPSWIPPEGYYYTFRSGKAHVRGESASPSFSATLLLTPKVCTKILRIRCNPIQEEVSIQTGFPIV